MINVSPFTKLYVKSMQTTCALIKVEVVFFSYMPVVYAWNSKPGPQLRSPFLNALGNGTNGNFGMGFSSTEAPCLHDILFTLSSRSKKWSSANVFGGKKASCMRMLLRWIVIGGC